MIHENELNNLFEYLQTNMNPGMIGLQLDLQYANKVSNSHSCPKNGVQNFSRIDDAPTSYPGLYGRVWYRTDGITKVDSFCQPVCGIIHTGTGGYGHYDGKWKGLYTVYNTVDDHHKLQYFSYDCKIFGDDFTDILALLAKYKMLRQEFPSRHFTYYYLNEEFTEKDKIVQAKYKRKQERRYLK